MPRLWLVSGAILGGIAVAAGSFGAHGLKDMLDAAGQSGNWETAVRYALFHAIALLVVGLASALPQSATAAGPLAVAGGCFLLGTIVFSGFLGGLALSGVRILGAIVPIGGVLMLIGWASLAIAGWRIMPRP